MSDPIIWRSENGTGNEYMRIVRVEGDVLHCKMWTALRESQCSRERARCQPFTIAKAGLEQSWWRRWKLSPTP